jgi:hypothetical protein
MEFLKKYQIVIMRSLGGFFLLAAFISYFWSNPKGSLSETEKAEANLARMEASVSAAKNPPKHSQEKPSIYLDEFKKKREKQMEYFIVLLVLLGIGFFAYSFVKKPSE